MRLPGPLGVVQSVANHVRTPQPEISPDQYAQTAAPYPEWQQTIPGHDSEYAAQAMLRSSRHRLAGRAITSITILGVTGGILYACSNNGDQSFGHHNNAEVNSTETTVGHAELTADLSALTLDASNDSEVTGLSYTCLKPWGNGWCIPDSLHQASIHTTGKVKLTAHSGALAMTGHLEPNGQATVNVDVDTKLLESSVSSSTHTVNTDGNHNVGWDGLLSGLGLGSQDKQATLQTDAETNGDDAMQASVTHTLEADPKVVDAAFAQALRAQAASNEGLLSVVDGNGAKLLQEMADPRTVYVFSHGGEKLSITPERPREFQGGQTVMIEGVKVTFGKDKPVVFSQQAADLIGNLKHDNTVEVTNEPSPGK